LRVINLLGATTRQWVELRQQIAADRAALHVGYGVLGGTYVGASCNVSFGLGLGANVLVGGSHRTISPCSRCRSKARLVSIWRWRWSG
jgi:hypothetical protein